MRSLSKDKNLISVRRAHIAKCASSVFIKKGYDTATIPDIAEACNMSVGSLYRYIGSKEDILYLVIDNGINREISFNKKTFQKARLLDPVKSIKMAMSDLIKSVDEIQDMLLLSYRTMQNIEPAARENVLNTDRAIINGFEKILINGQKKGIFEFENVHLVAQTIVTIAQMWVIRRWTLRHLCTLNEYIKFHQNHILKWICKESPDKA